MPNLKPVIQKNTVRRRLMPVLLSMLVAVSATATAGMLNPEKAPTQIAAAKKAPDKTQEEPARKEAADKADEKEQKDPKVLAAEIDASIASAVKIDPLVLLKEPNQYLNQKITFVGTFNRFADVGLDYKKAFRDSRDYVSFFILRPDVNNHTIPLSEMKLFFPRKQSDEVMDLESGDQIQIVGTEFSTALEEPWIDVQHIKILKKTDKPERKHEAPEL